MRKNCPKCGRQCYRDEVYVMEGCGPLCGPWGCPSCGWSEDEDYDLSGGADPQTSDGVRDQFGGLTPGARSEALRCFRCHRTPAEIAEYVEAAEAEPDRFDGPDDFVRRQEGTLNRALNTFACTACYIAIGQPSRPAPSYWTAPGLTAEAVTA